MKNIVLIGNSIANRAAIEEIRKNDKDSTITLVSADAFYPYGRDRLLAHLGREIKEKQVFDRPESFYKTHNVRVVTGQPVARFNFKRNQVVLENKEQLAYDILILADLAAPRLPDIKGNHKSGVYHASRLADVKAILDQALFAETIVVQVSSLAGFLTLCALSQHKKELVVSCGQSEILSNMLDAESSNILKQLLEFKGIRLMMENPIEEILGDSDVKAVRLKSGKVFSTEMVILDDIRLDTRIFKETGLDVSKEEAKSLFQTSISNVYWVDSVYNAFTAAGTNDYNTFDEVLEVQGTRLGQEICGVESEASVISPATKFQLKDMTGFWFGQTQASPESREHSRFDSQNNIYKKMFSRDGILNGAVFFNAPDQFNSLRELFNERASIQGIEDQLLDGQVALQEAEKLPNP